MKKPDVKAFPKFLFSISLLFLHNFCFGQTETIKVQRTSDRFSFVLLEKCVNANIDSAIALFSDIGFVNDTTCKELMKYFNEKVKDRKQNEIDLKAQAEFRNCQWICLAKDSFGITIFYNKFRKIHSLELCSSKSGEKFGNTFFSQFSKAKFHLLSSTYIDPDKNNYHKFCGSKNIEAWFSSLHGKVWRIEFYRKGFVIH